MSNFKESNHMKGVAYINILRQYCDQNTHIYGRILSQKPSFQNIIFFESFFFANIVMSRQSECDFMLFLKW